MDMGEAGRRLALTLAVGLAPAVAIAAEPEVLARIGQPAPGGGTFFVFDRPQINESGVVLFKAIVDLGDAGQQARWYLVDTYGSAQPELALAYGPSPDGEGRVTPVVAVLRSQGRAIDFWGSIDTPPPLTGGGAWFVREADGSVAERLRRGRPIGDGVSGPQVVCSWHLRIHPQGDYLVQAALVEAPAQCEGAGATGPAVTWRIAPDHTVTRLVGEGDAIANLAGATIGPLRYFFRSLPLERFSSYWFDASGESRYGMFRLGPAGPELEVADGDAVPGVGLVHFEPGLGVINPPRQLHPTGANEYLGRARVQSAADQPLRNAIVRFGPTGGVVLLEPGHEVPGVGRVAEVGTTIANRAAGTIVTLGEAGEGMIREAAVSVDGDGRLALGAWSGALLPGGVQVSTLMGFSVLPSGALVQSGYTSEGPYPHSHLLMRAEASGPVPLLPPVLHLNGVTYGFELPYGQSEPQDLWPVNGRGQVVALAVPRGKWDPNHLIVYYGGSVFRGDFEAP